MCAILAVFQGFCSISQADPTPAYPAGFLWGAAFSAHQTEGITGGGEAGDWWAFENPTDGSASPIGNGDTSRVAVDHWNRFDEDFSIAQKIGLNTVRISIAWEKIEPAPGVFSTQAIQHYRNELISMRSKGLIPMVALHHFTHPLWFQDRGSWLADESPWLFLRYARFVVSQLSDLCDLWITFNEPMVLVNEGFITGTIPPQIKFLPSAATAAFNLVRAHRLATAMIHEIQPPRDLGPSHPLRGVGLVNSLPDYEGYDPDNLFDTWAGQIADEVANWAFLHGAIEGQVGSDDLPEAPNGFAQWLVDPIRDLLQPADDLRSEEHDSLVDGVSVPLGNPQMDWLGVNYYTRYQMRVDWTHFFSASSGDAPGAVKGDNGWEVYPNGLEVVLRRAAARFHLPLVISETGVADHTDLLRQQYVKDSLLQTDRALLGSDQGPGLDIRGYYHWSLMDNFEWLGGYQYRFGLTEIRYDHDLERVMRPSAGIYHDEIQKRSLQE
jgi:beta-glucosidase